MHHYHVNCPPSPGAVTNATGCAAAAARLPPVELQAAPVPRRQDCPVGYVGCTDSHGSARCAPCAAQCWEFLDPTSPRQQRLADLLARLTDSEKISLLNNDAPGIQRLNVQPYTTSECLHGYATSASANGSVIISTQFPTPLNLGASFNTSLVEMIGRAIGYEARAHENDWNAQGYRGPGVQCLSPNANIARSPLWGRTQEVYSEDPTHAAVMVGRYVRGMQGRGQHPHILLTGSITKHWMICKYSTQAICRAACHALSDTVRLCFRQHREHVYHGSVCL